MIKKRMDSLQKSFWKNWWLDIDKETFSFEKKTKTPAIRNFGQLKKRLFDCLFQTYTKNCIFKWFRSFSKDISFGISELKTSEELSSPCWKLIKTVVGYRSEVEVHKRRIERSKMKKNVARVDFFKAQWKFDVVMWIIFLDEGYVIYIATSRCNGVRERRSLEESVLSGMSKLSSSTSASNLMSIKTE